MPQPEWIGVVSAMLTPLIALLAGFIAWRQWRTSRNTLKLALFDRRMLIYDGAMKAIASILQAGRGSVAIEHQYMQAINGARWLFNKKIHKYLHEELWGLIVDIGAHEKELEGLGAGEERSRIIREQRDRKIRLHTQMSELEKRLGPYLALGH